MPDYNCKKYNCKKEFAEEIRTGKKCQIIKKVRKNPIKVGDTICLFTENRVKIIDTICIGICPIIIQDDSVFVFDLAWSILVEKGERLDNFARLDGFDSSENFKNFFREQYGFPFSGEIIYWDYRSSKIYEATK